MASEWQVSVLEHAPLDIIDGDRGHNYPTQAEFSDSGHCLFLNAGNVTTTGFRFAECAFITASKDALLRKGKLRREDVVLTTRGTVGNVAYFDESVPFDNVRVNSGMVILRAHPDVLEPRYLYSFVRSGLFRSQVSALRTGSAQPQLPIRDINRIEIPIPPLYEQCAIAHILGTLDDKIELNRRLNETLDQMARALFKSWFVDFNPVRAKAEGRDTGLPRDIADLFPDRFEDSELGNIPEGWRVAPLGEQFDTVKGVSYKGSGLSDSGMPLHNLNSVYEGGGYKYEGIKYYNGEYAERHIVRPGDVIVANTEQGHQRLLIGYSATVPRLFGDVGIASHHIFLLRPREHAVLTPLFLCQLLNSRRMHDTVSGYANGTTVNMLPLDGVQKPKVVLPPADLVGVFDKLAGQVEMRRAATIVETRTLVALRDTLLPKLLSREIRVKSAEKAVAEAL